MNFGNAMGDDFSTPIDQSIIGSNRQLDGINMSEIIRQNNVSKNNEDLHSVGFGGMRQQPQSNNIQQPQSDPSRPSMEEMERVYNSVQSGEFVPKVSQVFNQPNNSNLNQSNTNVQQESNTPENGLNNTNTKPNDFGLDSDWLKSYVGNDKAEVQSGSQQNLNPTQLDNNYDGFNSGQTNTNQVRQENVAQQSNQQPLETDRSRSNSTQGVNGTNDIIAENERLLRTYGARTGLKGDDLIATASSISEDEIAMIYRMRQQRANEGINNNIPTKQQPGPDVTGIGSYNRQVIQKEQKPFSYVGMGSENFGI